MSNGTDEKFPHDEASNQENNNNHEQKPEIESDNSANTNTVDVNNWYVEFIKPYNAISFIIGLIGLIFGVYAYYDAKQAARMSFIENTIPVYSSSVKPSGINVFDSNGNLVENNIFVSEVVLWNSGNVDLGEEKVRSPVNIKYDHIDKIYSYQIVKKNNEFMTVNIEKIDDKSVNVKWKYFDPGNAVKINILYASDSVSNASLNGYIFGLDEITNASMQDSLFYQMTSYLRGLLYFGVYSGMGYISGRIIAFLIYYSYYLFFRKKGDVKFPKYLKYISILSILIAMFFFFYYGGGDIINTMLNVIPDFKPKPPL